MNLGLDGRAFIVTGGSTGLGFACARSLVSEGAQVIISGRDRARLDSAVVTLGPEQVCGVECDNASQQAPSVLMGAARTYFGRLDGLLISVGGPPAVRAHEATDEQWRTAFESVFLGAIRLARSASQSLGDGGSIVFVLSTSVRQPIPELGISNGLRPGLAMIAKSMANEFGPRGIRVNGLLPGRISTQRLAYLEAASAPGSVREAIQTIPLRRPGHPDEFARAAAFVLSPAASYITGAMIAVDGGAAASL